MSHSAAQVLALMQKQKARGKRTRRVAGEMNGYERQYDAFLQSRLLKGEIVWYKFEPFSLKVAKGLHYNPDFAFIDASDGLLVVIDVKGRTKDKATGTVKPFIEDDALVKIKAAAEMFPFRFLITWPLAGGLAWGIREVGE